MHEKVSDKVFLDNHVFRMFYNPSELRNPNMPSKNSNTGPTFNIYIWVIRTRDLKITRLPRCGLGYGRYGSYYNILYTSNSIYVVNSVVVETAAR